MYYAAIEAIPSVMTAVAQTQNHLAKAREKRAC
jgi:hypothetical protein